MSIEPRELAPLPWSTWWRSPRVASLLRELLGVSVRQVVFGMPRVAVSPPSPHACFVLGTAHGGHSAALLVPHAAVRLLADRVLGGSATLSEGVGTGAPLPAELGAVAYLCARLAAAGEAGWLLHDARRDTTAADYATVSSDSPAAEEAASGAAAICWPLAVHSDLGALALQVLTPTGVFSATFSAELLVGDDDLLHATLARGDLVLADGAALSLLDSGLCGALSLRVAGFADEVAVRVADGHVRGLHAQPLRPRATELLLATRQLDTETLLGLLGRGVHWPLRGDAPARLRVGARVVAEGELVWLRGALGLRITDLVD